MGRCNLSRPHGRRSSSRINLPHTPHRSSHIRSGQLPSSSGHRRQSRHRVNLGRRKHRDAIPRANLGTKLAPDTASHVDRADAHGVKRIVGVANLIDAIHRADRHAGLAAGAEILIQHGERLRFLLSRLTHCSCSRQRGLPVAGHLDCGIIAAACPTHNDRGPKAMPHTRDEAPRRFFLLRIGPETLS